MPISGLWVARIGYIDRESTVAYMVLPFGTNINVQGTLEWLATDAAFQGISDAQRCSASLQLFTYVEGDAASNVAQDTATLVFSTDDPHEYGLLDIPGCMYSFATLEGCFAGRAINITLSEIVALAELVTTPPALVTPSGLPFRALVAAGYRAIWRDVSRRSG
jgi:hypothetical protein